jgi:protein-L-isoaspartate(D-aspartate) O-methyltransferase
VDRDALLRELRAMGIGDERVLAAIAAVPRPEFVPVELRDRAWENHPLGIGHGQTISQPYIVAYMTESLDLEQGDSVLDVGTGCGYQAAVLAALGVTVTSIEVVPELAESAAQRLHRLGYRVDVRSGDGRSGVPDHAPYDAILVAAASEDVPTALLAQLRPPAQGKRGGRLIIPVAAGGRGAGQRLVLFEREEPVGQDPATEAPQHGRRWWRRSQPAPPGFRRVDLLPVAFVPLVHGRGQAPAP